MVKVFALYSIYFGRFYQRTNGPVNAYLRSVVYTNKHVCIDLLWKKSPSNGADDSLVSIFFFIIINILICQFPASLSLQPTNNTYPHSKA